MTPEQLREAIARGNEQASVEFKVGGPRTDRLLLAKVIRAMLAMANRRYGGVVVLGVEERPSGLEISGLDDAALDTWKYDLIADTVAIYADPHIEFERDVCTLDSKALLILTVKEFSDTPVLCKKQLTLKGVRIPPRWSLLRPAEAKARERRGLHLR